MHINIGYHTKYCSWCHIVLYVTVITFLTTHLIYDITSIVIPTYIFVMRYLQRLIHFTTEHLHDEILSWMIEIWMENDLISDSNCNIVNI